MTSRQLRLLRGAAASSIATVTAAVSHTLGGGAPPHPLLVIALCVFLTPVAAVLVGRTLHLGKLSAAVLLSQTVFHVLFSALGATLTSSGTVTGHHHHHSLPLALNGQTLTAVAPDAGMLTAHLVAAVATIAMLWRGEQLARTIAQWVRTTLRRWTPRPLADFPRPAALEATARRFVSVLRVGDLSLRGPPLSLRG
ncbi:hypothetical protein [Microbacterium sp.]|uniref:hypothetical protein n=1 Tax=Microbacterium sp. TaxID=51671 RepID=UPI0026086311|nr:hypothetical protein [Microbacterium sp.]